MYRFAGFAAAVGLMLAPASARAAEFSSSQPLSGSSPSYGSPPNKWNPYPATIDAQGLQGTIASVRVRIDSWYDGDTQYTDVLLESPDGRYVMLSSDAGYFGGGTQAADNVNVIFAQDALRPAPSSEPFGAAGSTVEVRPANYDVYADDFPELPAAADSAPADLNTLVGGEPNGQWKLYVTYAGSGGGTRYGSMQGWSIDVTTKPAPPPPPPPPPPPATGGGAQSTPAPPLPPAPDDIVGPSVSRVAVQNRSFRPASTGGPLGRTGAVVGFRLSEAARVVLDLERLIAGRRVGGRCVRATRRNRRRPRCTRAVAVPGSFALPGQVGDNTLRFSGRVNGRVLSPGTYRLNGVAIDAAGNRSAMFSVTLRVLRRTRRR